jgi:saccharopine dehydrogenase-like NADP-dependent oxidoreductase
MRIVVLGGAGKMGCIAVQCLARDARVQEVILADVNQAQAELVIDTIGSPKVTFQTVDIRAEQELRLALRGASACLNATVYYLNLEVMQACLAAGVAYTDMGGLFHLTRKQLELHPRFTEAGLSAVLGMGSAPGVPNIQARYAADRLDTIESIRIYDGIKPPPPDDLRFTYAIPTILDELTMPPMAFEAGEFIEKEPLSGFEDYGFSPPIGRLAMHYSLHSEVATLPISFADQGVRDCFFKINYWGMAKETVEKVRVLAEFGFNAREPVEVGGSAVVPRDFMIALLEPFVPPITEFLAPAQTHPPEWIKEIVTEVHGTEDGARVMYRLGTLTCQGALPTGLAPAVAAIWLAEGRIKPGVYPPELAIEPEPFFAELTEQEIPTTVAIRRWL